MEKMSFDARVFNTGKIDNFIEYNKRRKKFKKCKNCNSFKGVASLHVCGEKNEYC